MHFVKMEGCGNDYIYVELEHETVPNPQRLARKISDRHFGVGADGLILIAPSDQADCRMEMYNADGSRGRMCGNGVRCVARYLYDYKKIRKQEISVETDSGIHKVRILEDSQKATVRMGAPLIEETAHVISMEGQKTEMTIVSMGNPHAVIFMTPEEGSWQTWDMKKAAAISTHSDFPEGINVELVQVYSETGMKVRVWRGGAMRRFPAEAGHALLRQPLFEAAGPSRRSISRCREACWKWSGRRRRTVSHRRVPVCVRGRIPRKHRGPVFGSRNREKRSIKLYYGFRKFPLRVS